MKKTDKPRQLIEEAPRLFEMTAVQLLDVARHQPHQLPRMTPHEGEWRKLFAFLSLYSEDPNAMGLYLRATHDVSEGPLRDVVENLIQARTVPGLFDRIHVVKAVLDFSKDVETQEDHAGTLSVLVLLELKKRVEPTANIGDPDILDMMIQQYDLATRSDLEWNLLRTDLCHIAVELFSSQGRLIREQMGDSDRSQVCQELMRQRLTHVLGRVAQHGGSLEREYQFEVYGDRHFYAGTLDMAVALDRNLRSGHGVIGALLDVGADWTRINLDTLRPDIRAVFDQHPSVRRGRLDKLVGGTPEPVERRFRM